MNQVQNIITTIMNNNFKNRQKSQLFQIITITFISLITCLLFSIFTPATANSP